MQKTQAQIIDLSNRRVVETPNRPADANNDKILISKAALYDTIHDALEKLARFYEGGGIDEYIRLTQDGGMTDEDAYETICRKGISSVE